MHDYRRPSLPELVFHDEGGAVIPYGRRWADRDWDGPEDTYSVTRHPERFAPFVQVAKAIAEHLLSTYDVMREESGDRAGNAQIRLVPTDRNAAPLTFAFLSPQQRPRHGWPYVVDRLVLRMRPLRRGCRGGDRDARTGSVSRRGWRTARVAE